MRLNLIYAAVPLAAILASGCVWTAPKPGPDDRMAGKPCKEFSTQAGEAYIEVVYGPEAAMAKPVTKPEQCKVKGGQTTLSWYGPAGQEEPFTLKFDTPLPGQKDELGSTLRDRRQQITVRIGEVNAQSSHKYTVITRWGNQDPIIIIER